MTLDVETVVAVSLLMAVFSAVAAVGTSVVLGAGYERLRAGFEIVSKQTGFFSDAIHKLEQKVEIVDKQTNNFTHSISTLEAKVVNVGEQAGAFSNAVQKLEQKVEIVDKQTGFFSDALYRMEKKIETINTVEKPANDDSGDMISTNLHESPASQNLLMDMISLSAPDEDDAGLAEAVCQETHFDIPESIGFDILPSDMGNIRFH